MTLEKAIPRWCLHVVACHKPDIVRIEHSFGEDWTGDKAVFFIIVVSDEMGRELAESFRSQQGVPILERKHSRCFDLTQKAQRELRARIPFEDFGYLAYFNVNTESDWKILHPPSQPERLKGVRQ